MCHNIALSYLNMSKVTQVRSSGLVTGNSSWLLSLPCKFASTSSNLKWFICAHWCWLKQTCHLLPLKDIQDFLGAFTKEMQQVQTHWGSFLSCKRKLLSIPLCRSGTYHYASKKKWRGRLTMWLGCSVPSLQAQRPRFNPQLHKIRNAGSCWWSPFQRGRDRRIWRSRSSSAA